MKKNQDEIKNKEIEKQIKNVQACEIFGVFIKDIKKEE